MNGKVSDGLTLTNFETYIYILGFNHNETLEGSGIVFGGFKTAQAGGVDICLNDTLYGSDTAHTSGQWFNINNSQSNIGGWKSSLMRTVNMPLIKAAFPSELQKVIKPSTIYTDNKGSDGAGAASSITSTQDDVYLLAEYEATGEKWPNGNSNEKNKQQIYTYYTLGNSKIKYFSNDNTKASPWYLRSPKPNMAGFWCYVNGTGASAYGYTTFGHGIAPAFRV